MTFAGRCFVTIEEAPTIEKEDENIRDADWPGSHQLLCREKSFVIAREKLKQIPSFPVVFHAKRFNLQLRELDPNFPSILTIDRALERCYDVDSREVPQEGMDRMAVLAKMLEEMMTGLGY